MRYSKVFRRVEMRPSISPETLAALDGEEEEPPTEPRPELAAWWASRMMNYPDVRPSR